MRTDRFNFRKALLWIGGVIAVGLVGLVVAPGNIEGIYSVQDAGCGCGHQRFLRFHEGSIFLYDTGHPPAVWGGTYEDNGDGTFTTMFVGGDLMLTEPGLLFVRMWDPTNRRKSGWDYRSYPTGEIQNAIRHHKIEKIVDLEGGEKEIEIYDPDMHLIERKPFQKP